MTFSNLALSFLVFTLFGLQSCSLISKQDDKNETIDPSTDRTTDVNTEVKAIGKSIVELGDIPNTKPTADLGSIATTLPTEITEQKETVLIQEKTQYQMFIAKQALVKSQLPGHIKTLYKSAIAEMKNKEWQKANELLDDVIDLYPNLSGAYLNKALVFYQLKQFNKSIEVLDRGLKVSSINPYMYNLKGVVSREQGQFDNAEKYYLKALTLWPNYAEVHLNIAVFYEIYRGEFIKAKSHYQRYLLLKPEDPKVSQWLAGLDIKLAVRNRELNK